MKRLFYLFSILVISSCTVSKGYDVAAYIWPAYHNDPRWEEIGLFPDGKGELAGGEKERAGQDGCKQYGNKR